jgi:hypothetical protein
MTDYQAAIDVGVEVAKAEPAKPERVKRHRERRSIPARIGLFMGASVAKVIGAIFFRKPLVIDAWEVERWR